MINGLGIAVEPYIAPVGWDIHLVLVSPLESFVTVIHLGSGDVCHRNESVPCDIFRDGESIVGGACTAAARADDRNLGGVIDRRVHPGDADSSQH